MEPALRYRTPGLFKPTDNYMVLQVTVDGVPMQGHTVTYPHPRTPVVTESEETDLNQPRMIARQFFLRVSPGVHTVTVNVAAGSNIVAPFFLRSRPRCCPSTTTSIGL